MILTIRNSRSNLFAPFWSLYENSFPENERRDLELQINTFQNKNYHLEAVFDEGLIGFISWWNLNSFVFIEHYMIMSDCCDRGWGTRILNEFILRTKRKIILEVEKPETDAAVRRIKFYTKNGFHLNIQEYLQPSYHLNKLPVPLLLMSHPDPIKIEEFSAIQEQLFNSVYS